MPAHAVAASYEAATTAAALFDASSREQLRVTGPDAVSFLQGMVTNDVGSLAPGASCYAALLTAKGGMVGDVRVLRREADLVVDTGPGRAATVEAFLQKYLISEDAQVHFAPELCVLSFIGPRARETAARVTVSEGELRPFLDGVDVLVPREKLPLVLEQLSDVPRVDAGTRDVLRVEAGVPEFGKDMTEVTIPLEANLDHALHYQKGCYIGQEVIARATYRGQMNKKLRRVLLGEAAPEAKTELRVGPRKVGWLTSVVSSVKHAQHLGLAYVHRDFLTPGTTLELASGGTATLL